MTGGTLETTRSMTETNCLPCPLWRNLIQQAPGSILSASSARSFVRFLGSREHSLVSGCSRLRPIISEATSTYSRATKCFNWHSRGVWILVNHCFKMTVYTKTMIPISEALVPRKMASGSPRDLVWRWRHDTCMHVCMAAKKQRSVSRISLGCHTWERCETLFTKREVGLMSGERETRLDNSK